MDKLSLIITLLAGLLVVLAAALGILLPWRLRLRHRELHSGNGASPANPTADAPTAPPNGPPPASQAWGRMLLGYLVKPLAVIAVTGALQNLLANHPEWLAGHRPDPRYVTAWYLFWFAILVLNINEWVGRFYYHVKKGRFPLPETLFFLARLFLVGAATFAIFHFVLDFDTSHLLTSTAVIAAVVGIAMREVLGHFLAGISMHLAGTVEPSQWIALGDKEGEIIQRNWRETRLRSTGGHIYVIPNSTLAGSVINNMTWQSSLRRHALTITVSHLASPQTVKESLMEAALGIPEVDRSHKPPDAFIHEFRDYGTVYQVRLWSHTYFDRSSFEGKVRERIWYQLQRRGITIPFPEGGIVPLFSPNDPPPPPPPDQETLALLVASGFTSRFLSRSDGTPLVPPATLATLAGALRRVLFGPGEVVLRQGQSGRACYILAAGELQGRVENHSGQTRRTFVVQPGDLVGEVAMVAGVPHGATVMVNQGEAVLLEMSPETLGLLLASSDEVREALGQLVAFRSRQMVSDLQEALPERHEEVRERLVETNLGQRMLGLLTAGRAGTAPPGDQTR